MEIHFDVNLIVKVKFRKRTKNDRYVYVHSKPIRRFFGLLEPKEHTKEGYLDLGSYYHDIYSAEYLKLNGKLVDTVNRIVYDKPWVEVMFGHGVDSVTRVFQTEFAAKEWVTELLALSEKRFETITY